MLQLVQPAGDPSCKNMNSAQAGGAVCLLDSEQRLYTTGATGHSAYLISHGLLRFERVTAAGTRRIIRIAGRGDLVGQEALLGQCHRDDAVACTPVTLRRVSMPDFDHEPKQTSRWWFTLMGHWQQTLDEAELWSTELASGPSRRRLLQLLARLDHHRDDDSLIWLPKRDQMGDMLNLTIETCSRVLSALRREGILRLEPPRHARLDDDALAEALAQADR